MAFTRGGIRERLTGSSDVDVPDDVVVEALDGVVEDGEQLEYRLPGKGGFVREVDGSSETVSQPADGATLVLVTDRKLLFVVAAPESNTVVDVAYTDIKRVDAHDGLLRSKLTVAVWGEGEYRMKIADGSELAAAVHHLREASECWDRVITALDDAYEQITVMGEQLEGGNLEPARNARERTNEKLDRARTQLDESDIDAHAPLEERIEDAQREQNRTEIQTRITRAETLLSEATQQTETREYGEAYQNFWYARDHLETALSISRQADLQEPPTIRSKLQTIENRLDTLEVKPIALGQQAVERAEGTDKLDVEVEAWQAAFEHYRDALTAGWGTGLDFSGTTEDLQFRTESIVGRLINSRQELAASYASEAARKQGDPERALERYDDALEQLELAEQLASEFRSGDVEEIREERAEIGEKRLDLLL